MMNTPFVSPVSRREMLRRTAIGFGSIGLAGTMQAAGLLGRAEAATSAAGSQGLHFAPRAKRVIYLFMNGGPSHVDTFDPKPALRITKGKFRPAIRCGRRRGAMFPRHLRLHRRGKAAW